MPKIDLGRVKGDPLRYEDLTEEQKLELKGEKGDMPVIKAGTTTTVKYNEPAKVTSETNDDVTSFNFQIPVGQKPPFYGAYADFPEVGDSGIMYFDNTVAPMIMYVWNEDEECYSPASGSDSIAIDVVPEDIGTYTETYTPEDEDEQSQEYKLVDTHPVINGVLDKLAFIKTHASAVWYNKLKNITVLQQLDNLASNIGTLAQLATTDKTSLVGALNELNGNLNTVSRKTFELKNLSGTQDANDLKATGAYRFNEINISNVPSRMGFILVFAPTTTTIAQIFISNQGSMKSRVYWFNAWTDWV